MAAPECEREVRKRRERRDSGCSHERKERRPHSEERPPSLPPPPLHDFNRLESERRAERLSRARRPQFGGKRRRQPPRTLKQHSVKTKENECLLADEDVPSDSTDTPNSPTISQTTVFCLSDYRKTLYVEAGAEAEVEKRRAECRRAESRARPTDCTAHELTLNTDRRLEKITKKINVLKKNIAKYESDFEVQNGYPIAATERITDVQLTRMYETLRRLQAEKRCLKQDPVEYALKMQAAKQQKERDDKLEAALNSDKSMAEVVVDIEEWLEGSAAGAAGAAGAAAAAGAGGAAAALAAEKARVQRALLRLEAARGRPPARSADRGAARHLYERYRAVKRALAHEASACGEQLATILEHEALLFHSSVDSSGEEQDRRSETSQDTTDTPLQSPPRAPPPPHPARPSPPTLPEEANEGLHCMSLEDLNKALIEAKMQKCILKRSIKEYEVTHELQNSRKLLRDDIDGKDEYSRYKAIRARIKLLNALINKQKALASKIKHPNE